MSDKSKLFEKKQHGDSVTIARMMGTTPMNVYKLLKRTNAKRHLEAVNALEKIIEARDKLLTNK